MGRALLLFLTQMVGRILLELFKKRKKQKKAVMIIMCPVHPLDSFTAERDLAYYKEISF